MIKWKIKKSKNLLRDVILISQRMIENHVDAHVVVVQKKI